MKIENVSSIAEATGKEKGFIVSDNKNTKIEISLIRYEFSKRLIWFVYFMHTQDNCKSNDKTRWMRFALIRIDDQNEEILSGKFIKFKILE